MVQRALVSLALLATLLTAGCGLRSWAPSKLAASAHGASHKSEGAAPPIGPAAIGSGSCATPTWLVRDLGLAASAHFPRQATEYEMNWNAKAWDNSFLKVTIPQGLWIGGYDGAHQSRGYSFWFPFDISKYDARVKARKPGVTKPPGPFCPVPKPVFVQERDQLIPAMAIDLGNGGHLAFATNQVITESRHAGMDRLWVYDLPGVRAVAEVGGPPSVRNPHVRARGRWFTWPF